MTEILIAEQLLNGLQLGIILFLVSAGLNIIFGVMGVVNLAHASLFMLGAFFSYTFYNYTESMLLGILLATTATAVTGLIIELSIIKKLYNKEPLEQLLATFGLLLFFDELTPIVWGPAALTINLPSNLFSSVEILPGLDYPIWRLIIIGSGLIVAGVLAMIISKTRLGKQIRAGAFDSSMTQIMGVNLTFLFTIVFMIGSGLAGLAGALTAPILTIHTGMGNEVLILAFVVIVIGGLGSIKGAFVASIIIGVIDTVGRVLIPEILKILVSNDVTSTLAPALSSILIYLTMIVMLMIRPSGLSESGR